jgi:carbonic anhydrase
MKSFFKNQHKKAHEWSYEGECGPQTWSKSFSAAGGKHQSPVNIDTGLVKYDRNLNATPLQINYNDQSCLQIKNTGHTFQIDGIQNNLSTVTGGPVRDQYNFLQLHMHWGDSIERGSEHLIDGKPYSAEV